MSKNRTSRREQSSAIGGAWLIFIAGLLAWLIPGAGHVLVGRTVRGVIIFLVIAIIFWMGMGLGGVMTVDYHYEPWWCAAQMVSGVHGLTGWTLQARVYRELSAEEAIGRISTSPGGRVTPQQIMIDKHLKSKGIALVAPAETVARAYSGTAGLLNLLCIFDAVMLAMMGRKKSEEHSPAPEDKKSPVPDDEPDDNSSGEDAGGDE